MLFRCYRRSSSRTQFSKLIKFKLVQAPLSTTKEKQTCVKRATFTASNKFSDKMFGTELKVNKLFERRER